MREIRYFGRLVDPAVYRRGFGFWGWLANVLNTIRAWLEKKVALAILRIECTRAGLTPDERKSVVRQAAMHPDFVPVLQQDLPRFVRKLMRDHYPMAYATVEERTQARYGEGRQNSSPKRPLPLPEGIAVTFSRYQQRFDRSARYVPGRRFFVDHGEHVEPVPRTRRSRKMSNRTFVDENGVERETAGGEPVNPFIPKPKPTLADRFQQGASKEQHVRLPQGDLTKQGK